MEFIEHSQMQSLLAEAKITSISEIIQFISDKVSKLSMQSYQYLEERINELERPKGMDRVMIQEVKALVQAMIDQRQQLLKRQAGRNYRENLANSFEMNEPSRRSLNEIDFTNLMNMQNGTQSQQLKRGSLPYIPASQNFHPKTEIFLGQIRELREQMISKPQRRQIQEIKKIVNSLSKDVISKVTFQQAQKLMIKFQKQIFLKIKEGKSDLQELQTKLQRAIQTESESLKQEADQFVKSKQINTKLQKKVKKYIEQMAYVRSDLQKMEKGLTNVKQECAKKHLNQIKNMQNLQKIVEQLDEQKKMISQKVRGKSTNILSSLFFSGPITFKNNAIVWQKQIFNALPDFIQFQSGKTNIRVVYPGIYQVTCMIYASGNSKKTPILLYNSDNLGKFQLSNSTNELLPKWKFKEWINIKHNKVNLTIKYQNQDNPFCVLIYIGRILS